MPYRVVIISPVPAPLTFIAEKRRAELERIFGVLCVRELSHYDFTPEGLAQELRDTRPDAVVITSAPAEHRHAIEELATELPVLRPMFKRERNARGEPEERLTAMDKSMRVVRSSRYQTRRCDLRLGLGAA